MAKSDLTLVGTPARYSPFSIVKIRYNNQRHIDRYLKNGVTKSIVHVIKHANFQLYRVHPDGVI